MASVLCGLSTDSAEGIKQSTRGQPQRDNLRSVGVGVQETSLAMMWCGACWTGFWRTPPLGKASCSPSVGRSVQVEKIPLNIFMPKEGR